MDINNYSAIAAMESSNWWYRARRDLLRRILKKRKKRFTRVLDAGCGTGSNLEVLREFSGQVYGLDNSDKAIEFSSRKEYSGFFKSSVEDCSVDMDFDLIILMDVLEHIHDDSRALKNAAGLLAAGGLVVVSVPAYSFLWNMNDEFSLHRRRYTPGALRGVIENSGLALHSLFGWNRLMFLPNFVYCSLFSKRGAKRNNLEVIPSFMNGILYAALRAENALLGGRNVFFGVSLVALCGRQD